MTAFDAYPWFSVLSSLAILALFTAHAIDAAYAYRRHHDDRAALELLIALTLAVAALGLLISASASFWQGLTINERATIRNVGLGLVRGTLLATAATLFLADRNLNRRRAPR